MKKPEESPIAPGAAETLSKAKPTPPPKAATRGSSPKGPGRRNQLGQAMGSKGLQTRRRLLDATRMLLRSVPLRELSVVQIVKAARLSPPTFYVYFNDVADAVLALTGEASQSSPALLGLVARRWRPAEGDRLAHEFIAGYLEQIESQASLVRVRNLAADEGDPRFSIQRLNAVGSLIELMAKRVEVSIASGALPANLEPRSASGALLALIERIAFQWPMTDHGPARRRLVDLAAFFATLILTDDRIVLDAGGSARALLWPATRPTAGFAFKAQKNQQGQHIGEKGQRTRQRLLEATEALAQNSSLFDFKVVDIVRRAGTSNTSFYRYFEDVPHALLEIIAERPQSTPELLDLLRSEWKPGECAGRAQSFVTRYIADWQPNRAIFRIRNLAADEGDQRFYAARQASVAPLVAALAERIAATQASGALPRRLHPIASAEGFMAMVERLAVTPNVNTGVVTTATVTGAAALLLEVLASGVPRSRQ